MSARKPSEAPASLPYVPPGGAAGARRHAAWLAKWKPIGQALRVGDRVVATGEAKWLGTVVEKFPGGGCEVVLDHCGTSGGGAAAMGCSYRKTGETVPASVVKAIVAALEKRSELRGCCRRDDVVTRILAAHFEALGRAERRPRGHRPWPRVDAGRKAVRR